MFSIEVHGLAAVRARVRKLPKQFKFAGKLALNEVAFLAARTDVPQEMAKRFDRPTPFILKSMRVVEATPDRLVATIFPESPGGKAIDPANVLRAEVFGGARKLKRSESAFRRIGILPNGYAMVPAAGAPRDGYGNVPGPFMVRLLSYFQAFGEQGYRANMTAKKKAKLARGSRRSVYGVQYFVSYGRLRSNPNSDAEQHLKPGIWQRTGTGFGSAVTPVFLFVRVPSYRVRLPFHDVIARTVQRQLPERLKFHLQRALATAR